MQKKTVAITTLGCKVNQFESASFITQFEDRGLEVVEFSQKADIYVINSCAVTGKAGAQSRQMVRRALRLNPEAKIIATGCYSQIASQEILDIAETPISIVGNSKKHLLVEIALSDSAASDVQLGQIDKKQEICYLPVKKTVGRTRAYVKIQDGCDNFCSYCIVPYARGRVRSLGSNKVMEQLDLFCNEGYREMVLTGIHVGRYGRDLKPQTNLTALINDIASRKDAIRYRISSLEPGELTDAMLKCMVDSSKFMPHLHLPLQSGDNAILKKMNRHYDAEQFKVTVHKIVASMPDAAIGLDVLVGFPGEDDQAFCNTVALIEELPISYLHVFPYSKRPGTAAAVMPGQISKNIKDERAALLRKLDQKKRTAFYEKHLGTTRVVLAESSKNKFKLMKGFSDNYIPVHFEAPDDKANQLMAVMIEKIVDGNVFGRVVEGGGL